MDNTNLRQLTNKTSSDTYKSSTINANLYKLRHDFDYLIKLTFDDQIFLAKIINCAQFQ